jgi:cobalt/nickel transport system permease protein
VLNGLMGIFLGWGAFPAILVGTTLQAVLFQFGGLTSLGVNTFNMTLPALLCYYAFRSGVRSSSQGISLTSSFLCGFGAVFLGSIMVAFSLVFTGKPFLAVAKLTVVAHLPVMVVEGIVTAFCVKFLQKVRPEILEPT